MKKLFNFNLSKYIFAIGISLIGSEAFKISSAIYIYKISGDFWLVTLLYLLIQLPSIIIYFFSHKLIKLFKDKTALLLTDLLSALFLLVVFLISLWYLNFHFFSIILIVLSTLLGTIHSYRFIHLKNIIYHLATNDKTLKAFNIGNSFATSIGFVFSPLMSFYLYNYLEFYWLIVFNILTYLISGFLYYSLKINQEPFEFTIEKQFTKNKRKILSWIFVFSFSILIGILLYPRQTGLIQFFNYINDYKYNEWSFWFTLIMSISGLLATILLMLLNHFNKSKLKLHLLMLIMLILVFSWIIMDKIITSRYWIFILYFVINAMQQFIFNISLPSFYSQCYKLFNKNDFHKQNGFSLIIRIIISSLFIILFTFINNQFNYYWAYLIYSFAILFLSITIIFSYIYIFKTENKNTKLINKFYSSKKTFKDYEEYTKNGLWYSEKIIFKKYFPNKEANLKIYDIGCGLGRTTFALKELYPNAIIDAIDINKKFIKICKKRNNKQSSISFKVKNITKIIDNKNKYDLIFFSFNGITNILDELEIKTTLHNIFNLLKENGKFIFTIHDMFSRQEYANYWLNVVKVNDLELFSSKKVLTNKQNNILIKNRFYTPNDMQKLLSQEFNFKILEVFKRDENKEEEWVKKISTPLLFYIVEK
ncbi:methyltransferase domain-containing protein [Mycoplasma sp. 744]|uniref:MFS transporter n=1 Tax=Mycoplasma sp. 744 TaxID=3108531 RepID=UPI002B1D83A0|nr:MFS transporter [Mycoplasma sp. 744]MEA4115437.1 methyltransferase domain-containing protein [Mycoplasma sp. 744]